MDARGAGSSRRPKSPGWWICIGAAAGCLAVLTLAGVNGPQSRLGGAFVTGVLGGVLVGVISWLGGWWVAAAPPASAWPRLRFWLVAATVWSAYFAAYSVFRPAAAPWLAPLASVALWGTVGILFHAASKGRPLAARGASAWLAMGILVQILFLAHLWFAEGPWTTAGDESRPSLFWMVPVVFLVAGLARAAFLGGPWGRFASPSRTLLVACEALAVAGWFVSGFSFPILVVGVRAILTLILVVASSIGPASRIGRGLEVAALSEASATGAFLILRAAMGV